MGNMRNEQLQVLQTMNNWELYLLFCLCVRISLMCFSIVLDIGMFVYFCSPSLFVFGGGGWGGGGGG